MSGTENEKKPGNDEAMPESAKPDPVDSDETEGREGNDGERQRRQEDNEAIEPPDALEDGVEEEDLTPEERTERRRERFVQGVENAVIQVLPGKRVLIVAVVFAVLYVFNSNEFGEWLNMESPTVAELRESGDLETHRRERRLEIANSFPDWSRFPYEANVEEEAVFSIQAFVDPNCPVCRRMFAETEDLNDAGISVEYIVVPRNRGSELGFETASTIYCADDSREAFEMEMRGETYLADECPLGEVLDGFHDRMDAMNPDARRPYAVTMAGEGVNRRLEPGEWVDLAIASMMGDLAPQTADQ
ncbi:hypothetical protein [Thioalkalivibrio sp. ALE19]|uniref:hypothetical protein n=1 Tax=Thioalkalivibrio sp. ALE19 TaxID=1266909 RepID=UPI000405FAD5|nr:hypothetical protein [Thioalkalivibrio sp. ALE19]